MPIEIKELHVRVSVNTTRGGGQAAGGGTTGDNAKDAIVAECVEQVLQIIQNKAER